MRISWRGSPGPYPLELHVRFWQTGLYFARLAPTTGSRTRRSCCAVALGQERVAVVLPTNTWRAYNLRDADGDGTGDTWYATERSRAST